MKGLVILVIGFMLGTFVSPSLNSLNCSDNQEIIAYQTDMPGQLTLGDGERSFEDESEKEVVLTTTVFEDFIHEKKIAGTFRYISLCCNSEQISPHQYTNLPPPLRQLILYS